MRVDNTAKLISNQLFATRHEQSTSPNADLSAVWDSAPEGISYDDGGG